MKKRKQNMYQTYVEQVGKKFCVHVQMINKNAIVSVAHDKDKAVNLAKKLAKQNRGEYRGFNIVRDENCKLI